MTILQLILNEMDCKDSKEINDIRNRNQINPKHDP
jgi:hypothetical protein